MRFPAELAAGFGVAGDLVEHEGVDHDAPMPPGVVRVPRGDRGADALGDDPGSIGDSDGIPSGAKVDGPRWRGLDRQRVQVAEIVGVHGGPSVTAVTEMANDAGAVLLLRGEQDRDIAARVAVDQSRPNADRAHLRCGLGEYPFYVGAPRHDHWRVEW
ncbi:hypothetical protein [Actinomadura madurae]|uniref:hypothetical protein n=1 Tax=Actinomadura madurae TaxID=1993 RepID=UPI0020D23D00|nr:hypothetical protein [Actinomadura madurae]MCQ0007670.1 hypothetical protein [Actinomadura madurae]